jgi:protein-S-isoprenylcysteine O-methyltransferase Ste14
VIFEASAPFKPRHNSDGSSCIIGSKSYTSANAEINFGENLLSQTRLNSLNRLRGEKGLTAERAIHIAVFALLLVGFWSVSAWASLTYLSGNIILEIAGVTLSWGIILLILYVSFKKLGWNWWSQI